MIRIHLAFKTSKPRSLPTKGATLAVSRSHNQPEAPQIQLKGERVVTLISVGSSLEICLVADETADLSCRRLEQTARRNVLSAA